MLQLHRFVYSFFILTLFVSVTGSESVLSDEIEKPYGIDKRTPWTTSKVVGSPDPKLPYKYKRSFPQLTLKEPTHMAPEPGSNRIWFANRGTGLSAIINDQNVTEVDQSWEITPKGFSYEVYNFTFHPNFEENGYVYVFINGRVEKPKTKKDIRTERYFTPPYQRFCRVSRFETTDTSPRDLIPESETIIIEWETENGHSGGGMEFDNNGLFYITTGDGTGDSDGYVTGQDITDMTAGVLRIDLDHPEEGRHYSIPKDNPFLHIPDAQPELYAFGLRAPWKMSHDPVTDQFWIGDVGQDLWENIYLLQKGGNYGWSVREGKHPFYLDRKKGPGPFIDPVATHHHTEARSITGGHVYRGKKFPELFEHYIYCDYETGNVWSFQYKEGKAQDHQKICRSTNKVAAIGLDHQGEIYFVDYSGEILELEPQSQESSAKSFPRKLSETGLFKDTLNLQPEAGVIPYAVAAEVWADGATMERYLALPGDEKMKVPGDRAGELPNGSVLVQTLSLEMESGQPQSARRLETRLLTRQENEWAGYSYLWNEEQTDATLVEREGRSLVLQIKDQNLPGGKRQHTWHIPSRTQCMSCHSRAANWVLGLSKLQLDRDFDYGNVTDNQLRTFSHIGLFEDKVESTNKKGRYLVDPYNEKAYTDARARSYLHVNCWHCHTSAGGGNAAMELGLKIDNEKIRIFNETPLHGTFGIQGGQLVAEGNPTKSLLLYRMAKLGRGRMPHLGSHVVDQKGVKLFYDWIKNLKPGSMESPISKQLTALKSQTSDSEQQLTQLLEHPETSLSLLSEIVHDEIPEPIQQQAIEIATTQGEPLVQELFENFLPETKRKKRLGTGFDVQQLLAHSGDVARGKELFFNSGEVQCRSCHLIEGKGKNIGPDLSLIGKKLTKEKILENIQEPSKVIEDKFKLWSVITTEGIAHSGLMIEQSATETVLNNSQGKQIRIKNDDIEEMIPQQKSLMPEELLRDLTAQQAADLLEYLSSLK